MLRTYYIFTYGFTAIEENIIGKMLPDKKSVLVSTDCFTDLVACNSYAILIHAASVADEDFKMLWNYYLEVGTNALEAIIVVGNTDVPKQLKKRIKVYFGFEELCQDLTYILLSAYCSHKKTVNFSATLANAIVILSKIRCCPGIAHTEVAAEYVIDSERRIDIVIQNPHFFIPIEVKIYAGEQEGQCYDYYQYAKNSRLVYLTRFGNAPSEYSRKKKSGTGILPIDRIQCISWAEDICRWLNKLTTQLAEPVKSTVMQYIDAIHVVADERSRKMMEKNLEILYESPDYFRAGIAIEKSMKSAKITLMHLVFDDLKKEMEKITSKYGLVPEKEFHYFTYEEKCNEKFYDGNASTCPGLNYIVKKAKLRPQNIQMWFRIEVQDNLYAGIALFDTKNGYEVDEITEQMIGQIAQYMNEDAVTPAGWWVSWCYPNGKIQDGYYDDVPDFKHMNPCAVSLVDKQNRMEFVKSAVKNFEEHILKHLKNL